MLSSFSQIKLSLDFIEKYSHSCAFSLVLRRCIAEVNRSLDSAVDRSGNEVSITQGSEEGLDRNDQKVEGRGSEW